MKGSKQGQKPRLNLGQAKNEEDEGDESKLIPYMGDYIMIQRAMVILEREKNKSSGNEDSWL